MRVLSKHFKTEAELLQFANSGISGMQCDIKTLIDPSPKHIISIVKDVTNGDWVMFYSV